MLLESPLVFDIVFEPIVALPVEETYITLVSAAVASLSVDIDAIDIRILIIVFSISLIEVNSSKGKE